MATTQTLTGIIKEDYAPNLTPTKILRYLDRAQNTLFNFDCDQHLYLNSNDDTFPYPILSTTDGTLEYEIKKENLVDSDGGNVEPKDEAGNSLTARRVAYVFREIDYKNYADKKFYGDKISVHGINPVYASNFSHVSYERVPVKLFDGIEGVENARIQFLENQGTTDDTFYVAFYYFPLKLSSVTIPLTIDGTKWEQALIDGAVGYYEDALNGESKRLEKFQSVWLPRYRAQMNSQNTNSRSFKTRRRKFG